MPRLLSNVLGEGGRVLFYLGIFAAIYTSILGHAAGLGYLGSHAWLRWQAGTKPLTTDYRQHPLYRWIVVWCLVSPLIWTIPGMPDFVTLTLVANSAQVVLLPLLAGGLWWITADAPATSARRIATAGGRTESWRCCSPSLSMEPTVRSSPSPSS